MTDMASCFRHLHHTSMVHCMSVAKTLTKATTFLAIAITISALNPQVPIHSTLSIFNQPTKTCDIPISATFLMVCLNAQTMESSTSLNCSAGIYKRAERKKKPSMSYYQSTQIIIVNCKTKMHIFHHKP